jgi:thiamine biosynthesis lipoprotein
VTGRDIGLGVLVAAGAAAAAVVLVHHGHIQVGQSASSAPSGATLGQGLAATLPAPPDQDVTRERNLMGTEVTIIIHTDQVRPAEEAIEAAFDEVSRLEGLMTTWQPTSVISQVNQEAGDGKPIPLDDDTYAVLERATQISSLTGGLFDPTVGVYAGVWKFDQDNDGTIPDPAQVRALLPLVDWNDLVVDSSAHTAKLLRAGQKITLGGIAKGYAVDRAVAVLDQHGFVDFLVQAGGDMYVSGVHGDRPWRVGIRDPRGPEGSSFASMDLKDETFSTSGDYERFVIKDGKRWHHLLDPRTGFPATASRSVTVVATDAMTADGISKALFILGPEGGEPILEKAGATGAVWVTSDNQVVISPGLKDRVHIDHPPTDGI